MQNRMQKGMKIWVQKWTKKWMQKWMQKWQVEENMDIKGGAIRVDVQTRHKIRCKTRLKTCRKT